MLIIWNMINMIIFITVCAIAVVKVKVNSSMASSRFLCSGPSRIRLGYYIEKRIGSATHRSILYVNGLGELYLYIDVSFRTPNYYHEMT